jgi:ABC-type nitrate/sulfonate/bicarbonate transport system permease component
VSARARMLPRTALIQLASGLAVLAGWEAAGRAHVIGGEVLPPASAVAGQVWPLLASPLVRYDIQVSVYEIWMGLLIGAGTALALGIALGLVPPLTRTLQPFLYWLSSLPKIIILPVVLLAVGSGFSSKIGLAAISAFFPMAITATTAVGEIPSIYLKAARCLNAGRLRLAWSVVLPATAGPVLSGLRLSLGTAVIGALLAETSVASAGVGFRAIQLYSQLRIPQMYALLLLAFLAAIATNAVISLVIRLATHHETSSAKDALA